MPKAFSRGVKCVNPAQKIVAIQLAGITSMMAYIMTVVMVQYSRSPTRPYWSWRLRTVLFFLDRRLVSESKRDRGS
jgi:hypothetical protein